MTNEMRVQNVTSPPVSDMPSFLGSEQHKQRIRSNIERQRPPTFDSDIPVLQGLPALTVTNLKMYFPVKQGLLGFRKGFVKAVDDVSFQIPHGKTLGIVGESGSGKSTIGNCIMRNCAATDGKILYDGTEITRLGKGELIRIRRMLQMIAQDPYKSLDPRMTIGEIIAEGPQIHRMVRGKGQSRELAADMLDTVGLGSAYLHRFPHELSGGQRQRVCIARALAMKPSFIVCDEIVSALDVSIQEQIISIMMKLQETLGLTYIFIGHDLSVVRHISDRIAVMYLGKIVELTQAEELYDRPLHPYTQALISAVPIPDPEADRKRERILLKGDIPSPLNPPEGCNFNTRCAYASERCRTEDPELLETDDGHFVACHLRPAVCAEEG
jgi:oligopeptide transport system ATP-binding protein